MYNLLCKCFFYRWKVCTYDEVQFRYNTKGPLNHRTVISFVHVTINFFKSRSALVRNSRSIRHKYFTLSTFTECMKFLFWVMSILKSHQDSLYEYSSCRGIQLFSTDFIVLQFIITFSIRDFLWRSVTVLCKKMKATPHFISFLQTSFPIELFFEQQQTHKVARNRNQYENDLCFWHKFNGIQLTKFSVIKT